MHPANLALRFFLELAALAGFAVFAWNWTSGVWRYLAAAAIVVGIGVLWATFAVPGDPSRSGHAPVPVSGTVRLILELLVLLGGAFALYLAGYGWIALLLAALIAVHYGLSVERLVWLLEQKR